MEFPDRNTNEGASIRSNDSIDSKVALVSKL